MGEFALLTEGTLVARRYRVGEVLGQGGMGAVYRVEDVETGAAVALKTLREDLYDREDLVKRFEREAQAASRIGHPNIVAVHAFGNDERLRTRFIIQDLLRGADVSDCLNELGGLSSQSTIAIALQVMDALVAAHALGIIHRDIKPENVFLHETDDGVVIPKVIDFGIAKVIDALDRSERTATGLVFGTPWYMSPEQALGDSSIDARTDIWSVGTMLYEMLCGTLPFGGSNPNAVMAQIIYGRPTPLKDRLPDVAPDLEAVVHRAIERQLDRRFRTMMEFRDALAGCALWRGVTPDIAQQLLPRPSTFDGISAILPEEFLVGAEEKLGARRSRQASRRGVASGPFEMRAIVPTVTPGAAEPPTPVVGPSMAASPIDGPPEDEDRVATRPLGSIARAEGPDAEAGIPPSTSLNEGDPPADATLGSEVSRRWQRVGFISPPTEPPPLGWMRGPIGAAVLVLIAVAVIVMVLK